MTDTPADNQPPNQPGQVIAPSGTSTPAPQAATPTPVAPAEPQPAAPQSPATEEPAPTEAFADDEPAPAPSGEAIEWTASEFISHEKNSAWYMKLAIAAGAAAAVLFLITGDLTTAAVVLICAAFLGFYGARKPRQLQYRIDNRGITIGKKQFEYGEFRSFSVIPEGAFSSIMLMPLKRFAPTLSIYYAPEHEDVIAEILSQQLPYQERRADAVDRLMRHIRF